MVSWIVIGIITYGSVLFWWLLLWRINDKDGWCACWMMGCVEWAWEHFLRCILSSSTDDDYSCFSGIAYCIMTNPGMIEWNQAHQYKAIWCVARVTNDTFIIPHLSCLAQGLTRSKSARSYRMMSYQSEGWIQYPSNQNFACPPPNSRHEEERYNVDNPPSNCMKRKVSILHQYPFQH